MVNLKKNKTVFSVENYVSPIINWVKHASRQKTRISSLYMMVTLKIRSRSPDSKQLIIVSKWYNI